MSMNAGHAAVLYRAFGLSNRRYGHVSTDWSVVCLLSFLGLAVSALAIALGFGAAIADAFSLIG